MDCLNIRVANIFKEFLKLMIGIRKCYDLSSELNFFAAFVSVKTVEKKMSKAQAYLRSPIPVIPAILWIQELLCMVILTVV